MFKRFLSLWRVTAIRLSIIYTLIFGILAAGIVVYMTGGTINVLSRQYQASIDQEIEGLARIYRRGGVNSLVRTLERRMRGPGANLYIVANAQGEIIAGNVPSVEPGVMNRVGWKHRPIRYARFAEDLDDDDDDDDDRYKNRAIGRVIEVPNGMRLLVGRDIRQHEELRDIVRTGFSLALGTMLVLGFLTWFFVGRRALKRIDSVSQSSQRIMSGDRSERLPISGSNDEFDRLSENLNTMLDRINSLDRGVKQMSDNIAHDLKTPITRLRNKADEALSLNAKPDEQQQAIAEIIENCDQIVRTFDALLMISRVESGSSVAKMDRLKPDELLADVHELYEAVAEDANVRLALEIEDGFNSEIRGNRELLSQALSNLIDNGLKYGGDALLVGCKRQGEFVELSVTDNGSGIPEDKKGGMTNRFTRLDASRSKEGNGLGLSLVKAITEFHSGELRLEDAEAGSAIPGLKVTLRMPTA